MDVEEDVEGPLKRTRTHDGSEEATNYPGRAETGLIKLIWPGTMRGDFFDC